MFLFMQPYLFPLETLNIVNILHIFSHRSFHGIDNVTVRKGGYLRVCQFEIFKEKCFRSLKQIQIENEFEGRKLHKSI